IYARLEPGAPRVVFAIKKVFEYSLARNRNPRKGSSLKQRRRSSQDRSQPPRAGENTMNLTAIDWSIIAVYFLISIVIGLHFTRRAGKSTDEYFLGGRSIPWWLAGVSIVATTFSSDTPLLVTGITARGGIAGNWVWWAFVLSGMLTVFFFARLWRRANVMTDVEFTTIRYSGKAADFLRIFRAVYLSVPINAI